MVRVGRVLASEATVYAACVISLALGLVFIFAWAPHPWGWEGFDHYHQLALAIASGQPFPTMDVPWGYAYFAALWYRLFGDRPWIVLVVQALLNAALPWLVYRCALAWTNRRAAIAAALITGIGSFNTVYASTQSSDAVCTVLFMAAVLIFAHARRDPRWWRYAAAGVLAGVASQFRPNLALIPLLLAAYTVATTRTTAGLARSAVLVACAAAVLLPWIVRNYRLTGMLLPTSVHGAVQLWYGTLETGPYLRSQAHNPRAVFEAPVFDYTSLADVPLIVDVNIGCTERPLLDVTLVSWTDAYPAPRSTAATSRDGQRYTFALAPPHREAVVYYYVATRWSDTDGELLRTKPPAGAQAPLVYFVSDRHLTDIDAHDDLLDVFDVVRLAESEAWHEPVAAESRLRAAGVVDVASAATMLLASVVRTSHGATVVQWDATQARISFFDGSSITVPRQWSEKITDLEVTRGAASTVMNTRRSLRELAAGSPRLIGLEACLAAVEVSVNSVFYRREPQMMRRYTALAFDNIRRDPLGFLAASAYRAGRMFIVTGATDVDTAHQFAHSSRIYAAALAASTLFLTVFGWGVVVGIRRGAAIGLPLLLIAYVPLTLAPVLINMRYTVTVQPLMFIIAALALTSARQSADIDEPVSHSSAG